MLVSIRCDKTKLRETPKAIKLVLTYIKIILHIILMETKKCSVCKENRTIDLFGKLKDGLRYDCKLCRKEYR